MDAPRHTDVQEHMSAYVPVRHESAANEDPEPRLDVPEVIDEECLPETARDRLQSVLEQNTEEQVHNRRHVQRDDCRASSSVVYDTDSDSDFLQSPLLRLQRRPHASSFKL